MSDTASLRIIIADDEGVIRMGLRTMLNSLGHKVVGTARSGQEAIDKVKQIKPDLLLLDIKMPGLDGLIAAEILAEEAPLPIVMLTAFSQKELIEKAINALVMGYLVKPVDENRLAPILDVAVTRYREMVDTATELDELRKRLADQTMVNRAKQHLMQQGFSENEAYHQLQSAARRRQISMAEMAERVIIRGGEL